MQTPASWGRGASPGRFLYGRGADAGISRASCTIVETRAGVAPRRPPPPPPPFLPTPGAGMLLPLPPPAGRKDSSSDAGAIGGTRRAAAARLGRALVSPAEFADLEPAPRGSSAASVAGASALSLPPTGRCCLLAAAATRAPGAAPPPTGSPDLAC